MSFNPSAVEIAAIELLAKKRIFSHAKEYSWVEPTFYSISYERVKPSSDIAEIIYTYNGQDGNIYNCKETYELVNSTWKPHLLLGD